MIKIDCVSKTYKLYGRPIKAADNISLDIVEGEFLMVTGPSGSGKTTLLNLIGGMTKCDSGTISVNGIDITHLSNAKLTHFRSSHIGFIFQFQSMIYSLNVLENIMLPSLFSGKKIDKSAALSIINEIGIKGRERAYAHQLSSGQQRRVAAAREILRESKLLLCDEPTGDLDPDTENLVMGMISEQHRKGATVVLATHNHALDKYATKFISLLDGRIA